MSIQFSQNIKFYAEKYLDSRQKFETIEEMKNFSDVPNGFICFNEETKRHYIYDMSSSFNSDLGKWKTSLLLENSINELINQQDELYLQKSKDYSHSKFSLIEHKHTKDDITYALGYTPVDESQKGEIDGIAELDSNGKVPSHQLPSYVDDVLEGTYIDKTVFNDLKGNSYSPETGKIYIDTTTNKSYRWSGSIYTIVASDLALGETMSSAYRGDRGKTAYEHSQNKHAPVNAEENTINIIKKNGETISPVNKSIDIKIPTKTSELENDNGFVTTTDGMVSNADMLDGKHADEFSLIEHNHDDNYLRLNGGEIKSEDETLTLSGLGITGNGNTYITDIDRIYANETRTEYITADNIQSLSQKININNDTDFTSSNLYSINELHADKIYESNLELSSKYTPSNTCLPLSGGNLSGDIEMNGNNIKFSLGDIDGVYNLYAQYIYEQGKKISELYASKSHTHSYLPNSGGTLSGNLTSRTVLPSSANLYDLGTCTNYYKNLYTRNIIAETSSTESISHSIEMGYPGKDYIDFNDYGGVFNFNTTNTGTKAKNVWFNKGNIYASSRLYGLSNQAALLAASKILNTFSTQNSTGSNYLNIDVNGISLKIMYGRASSLYARTQTIAFPTQFNGIPTVFTSVQSSIGPSTSATLTPYELSYTNSVVTIGNINKNNFTIWNSNKNHSIAEEISYIQWFAIGI